MVGVPITDSQGLIPHNDIHRRMLFTHVALTGLFATGLSVSITSEL